MTYTVGRVAELARISIRTLHHYDDIGLLAPSARSEAGYRLYAPEDLARLQRILAYKELGFGLDAIRELLDGSEEDPLAPLRHQLELLDRRAARLDAMRHALQRRMEALKMGIDLSPEEMFEVFGDVDPTAHAEEAEARWGDTDAYRQSQARARRYGKREWTAIRDEGEAIERDLAAELAAGTPPDAPRAMELAEAHRAYIGRWFYDCSTEMHAALADMYTADPRFEAHYEARAEGLAAYVARAIRANAARA